MPLGFHAARNKIIWMGLYHWFCGLLSALVLGWQHFALNPHLLMGFFFGLLHLAYGAYLYLTEKKNPVA